MQEILRDFTVCLNFKSHFAVLFRMVNRDNFQGVCIGWGWYRAGKLVRFQDVFHRNVNIIKEIKLLINNSERIEFDLPSVNHSQCWKTWPFVNCKAKERMGRLCPVMCVILLWLFPVHCTTVRMWLFLSVVCNI